MDVGELTVGVEIDGQVVKIDEDWNRFWSPRGYSGPGPPHGNVATVTFENIENTFGLIAVMYAVHAKELVFTLNGEQYNARLHFDVTGFQEAFQPLFDHCGI